VRRAVPGPGAAGREPQVQGAGHRVGQVRERQGQVRRRAATQALPLGGRVRAYDRIFFSEISVTHSGGEVSFRFFGRVL